MVVDAAEDISITSDQKLTLTAAGDATLTTEPGGDGAPGNVSVTAKGKAAMKGSDGRDRRQRRGRRHRGEGLAHAEVERVS